MLARAALKRGYVWTGTYRATTAREWWRNGAFQRAASVMRQELWPAVESALAGALEVPEAERREWLARACADSEIRAEVEALLGVYTRAEGFLSGAHGLLTGARLGPYDIVELIGAGGMGEVYRARDPRIGRDVAIKVLPSPLAGDADRVRRFTLEVHAAGRLNHPNVMAI